MADKKDSGKKAAPAAKTAAAPAKDAKPAPVKKGK